MTRHKNAPASRNALTGLLAGLVLLAASPAFAAPMIFFGEDLSPGGVLGANSIAARAAFLSNLTGVGTEDFEGLAAGSTAPLALSFPGSGGALGATLTGSGCLDNSSSVPCPVSNPGRFPLSGDQFWEVESGSFSIDFGATPISAFGFNGSDIGDFVSDNLTVTLTDTSDVDTVFAVGHTIGNAADGNSLFWGFIDDANSYKSLTFTNPGGGDVFAFDDMTVGDIDQVTLVPEPGTLALLGLGIAAFGLRKRAR